jgi:hypothetical protein
LGICMAKEIARTCEVGEYIINRRVIVLFEWGGFDRIVYG